jgi:acyl-CoA synthetase (AMP-forming)/AMP-acid ligase II
LSLPASHATLDGMHPSVHARERPEAVAIVMGDGGERVTYAELESRSNRVAQLFRSLGLGPGDAVALMLENHPRFLELCVGAHRAGLYYTPVSSHLTPAEVEYIAGDSGARVFITSSTLATTAQKLGLRGVAHRFMLDGVVEKARTKPGLSPG